MSDRRDFLKQVAAAGVAVWIGGRWQRSGEAMAAIEPPVTLHAATVDRLPVLRVRGTHKAIGEAIGGELGMETQAIFYERRKWFSKLKSYARSKEGKSNVSRMRSLAEKHAPGVMEELAGWSSRCGVSLDDMFVMNVKNEIDAFKQDQTGCPGCSSVALKTDKGIWVLHNEDGHPSCEGRMFILDAKPEGGTEFVSHTYPGIVSGNASWLNEHGVFMTTNYIPSAKVKAGIPRYFLYRKAMECRTVDEVLSVLTHKERAYAGHHFVGSLADRTLKSVEITPEKESIQDVKGLLWHTNHLVHETMKGECQFEKYMAESSHPRYARLTELLTGADPATATPEQLHAALNDHEGEGTHVCRHAPPDPRGMTLGRGIFVSAAETQAARPFVAEYIKGWPCSGKQAAYPVG